jgi:hypothetical protein
MGAIEYSKALMWRISEEMFYNWQFYLGPDRRINRIRAVQQALDGRVAPVYLEVGVSQGFAFRRIAAGQKIAVDPEFKLSARSRRLATAKARVARSVDS